MYDYGLYMKTNEDCAKAIGIWFPCKIQPVVKQCNTILGAKEGSEVVCLVSPGHAHNPCLGNLHNYL